MSKSSEVNEVHQPGLPEDSTKISHSYCEMGRVLTGTVDTGTKLTNKNKASRPSKTFSGI